MTDAIRNVNISGQGGLSSGLFNASYAQGLAQKHYLENLASNKTKNSAKVARQKLLDHLIKTKTKGFKFTGKDPNDNPVTLDVTVTAPVREYIDVVKLAEEIGSANALAICTVSRSVVEEKFGKITAAHCGKETILNENVNIKVVK